MIGANVALAEQVGVAHAVVDRCYGQAVARIHHAGLISGVVARGAADSVTRIGRIVRAGEDRRPTLTWPRQIPLGGEPADVTEIAAGYAEWLATSDVPKLFINAEPGAILTGPLRETARGFANQAEVTVQGNQTDQLYQMALPMK